MNISRFSAALKLLLLHLLVVRIEGPLGDAAGQTAQAGKDSSGVASGKYKSDVPGNSAGGANSGAPSVLSTVLLGITLFASLV